MLCVVGIVAMRYYSELYTRGRPRRFVSLNITGRYLIGERASVELFVMRVSRRPADAHTLIDFSSLHPAPLAAHAVHATVDDSLSNISTSKPKIRM